MLVDGPVEWAETEFPVGSKLDLLKHAYNARLGIAALPRGATVALARYRSATGIEVSGARSKEVMELAVEEIVLHADADDAKAEAIVRHVAWSSGYQTSKQFLAIASMRRVEVWELVDSDSIVAKQIGREEIDQAQGLSWNPAVDTLLVNTGISMVLIQVDGALLKSHTIELSGDQCSNRTKFCSWSPCGLTLMGASSDSIRFFSWPTTGELVSAPPDCELVSMSAAEETASGKTVLLTGAEAMLGAVTAAVQLSATVCIVATDVPLVIEGGNYAGGSDKAHANISMIRDGIPSAQPSPTPLEPSSHVIDLTSLRITATSRPSLLRVLDQPNIAQPSGRVTRTAHLIILSKGSDGSWRRRCQTSLGQLAVPDVLDVEGMRVVVGSTISNRLLAVHLDHSVEAGWSTSLSGELLLPEGHACRGIRLTKTSPFVQVASTEKIKRTFFHAGNGSQRIHLSKFKVPRRRDALRAVLSSPVSSSVPVCPGTADSATSLSGGSEIATVLSLVEAMQTQLLTRFDRLDRRLDDVCSRLNRIEVASTKDSSTPMNQHSA